MRPVLFFFLFIVFWTSAIAQVSFEASTDAKQVVENGYFQITFTLNNAKGSNFKAPSFTNFTVLNGPSRSMSTTIINGNASQKVAYSYSLQPKKVGKFSIGAATMTVNGKTMKSNKVIIDVVKASEASKNASQEQQLFVKAEIDTNLVYVGQQLVVNYKLYTSVNIENYDIAFEPEYQGFFARDIRRFDSRQVREVVDGVQYITKVLKRIALFPQQTGLQKIEPMTVRLGVIVGKKRPNSFFFNNQIKPVNVQTNPLEINVKSLPQPIPSTFSGAVGKYAMNSYIDKNNITTDDAIGVKLTIQGNGDIKRLQPPNLDFPSVFEVYEPKVLDEISQETGGILKGQKTMEYLVLPKQAGNYQIKPAFTYFDTDSAKFITLVPNLFRINVRQGKGAPASQAIAATPNIANKDIRYIKTATSFSTKSTPFPKTGLFYGLLILPFLVLSGAFAYKKILTKNGTIDLILLKRNRAEKVAKKRLATAEGLMKANKSRAFYDEISRALLGYVCDKLNIPLSELTKDNVSQKLQSLNVQEQHITDYMSIIKITEMALFAGMDNPASMQDTYHKSVKVISEIETELT
ncbi:MAG: BatD family protein [Saprospiraceae bacterium]